MILSSLSSSSHLSSRSSGPLTCTSSLSCLPFGPDIHRTRTPPLTVSTSSTEATTTVASPHSPSSSSGFSHSSQCFSSVRRLPRCVLIFCFLLARAHGRRLQTFWGNLFWCHTYWQCRVLTVMVAFSWLCWIMTFALTIVTILFAVANSAFFRPLHGRYDPHASYYDNRAHLLSVSQLSDVILTKVSIFVGAEPKRRRWGWW